MSNTPSCNAADYKRQMWLHAFMLYMTLDKLLCPKHLPLEQHGTEPNPEPEPYDDGHAGRERKPAVSSGR